MIEFIYIYINYIIYISDRISRKSSSAKILEQSKPDFEEALKKWGHKAKLLYIQPNLQQKNTENHLVQPTFQVKRKKKRGKNVFSINRHIFPSKKQVA